MIIAQYGGELQPENCKKELNFDKVICGRAVMANYKEKYLAGEIVFEEIDEYSYQWGMSDEECTLAQYLGLNAKEEDAWVSIGEDALRELLDKQKK